MSLKYNYQLRTRWGRQGGSNSDSESPVDDGERIHNQKLGHSRQPNSADFSVGGSNFGAPGSEYRPGQSANASIFQSRFHNSSTDQSHAIANATPSPQLSLAEFLQNE